MRLIVERDLDDSYKTMTDDEITEYFRTDASELVDGAVMTVERE